MRRIPVLLIAASALAQDASRAEAEKKMQAGEFAAALAEFDRVIAATPDDVRAHAGRAYALQALGRLDDSLAAINRAIEISPASGALYQQRGFLHQVRGDAALVLPDLTKGIEVEPGRGTLYRNRGDELRRRHDYAGALQDYLKAFELNARDLTALERRAQTKESLRDFKGAIEDYTLLTHAAPNHPRPFHLRGDVKLLLEDWKGAVDDYDAAVYNDEKDAHGYIGRARAKRALGKAEEAEADAARACETPAAVPLSERGRYYYDTGRPKEAAADLAKSVEMDPRGQDYTRFVLFLARAKLGEREAATKELKAFADGREEKDDWYGKVAALLTGQAKEEALLAAAKDGNENRAREQECEACWYAGAIRLLDGDAAGAKALFERCVATDVRNFIEHQSAKAALAAMK